MPFFFFLSGMLCKRNLSLESIRKDFIYLIIPYFTYGFLFILFDIVRSANLNCQFIIQKIVSLLYGYDVSIGPIWFLPALFLCKQQFLVLKLLKEKNSYFYYSVLILFVLSLIVLLPFCPNLPFFSDSAMYGLPFFVLGNETFRIWEGIENNNSYLNIGLAALLGLISIPLCYYNGYVVLADCIFGKSVFLFYLNAIISIISFLLLCLSLSRFKSKIITITSYGSIVILGLHGIILTFFNYYFPILIGTKPSSYFLILAIVYSLVTYYICYLLIIFIDAWCPIVFGLKRHSNHFTLVSTKK